MVGVTPQIMREGMRADYRLVDRSQPRSCASACDHARRRCASDAGAAPTSRATFDPALAWVKTSGLINPRYWSNLPAGEVFTTPALGRRHVRLRRHRRRLLRREIRRSLDGTPLTLEIARRTAAVAAHCDRADLEREFWDYCHTDENSDRVGELAFGTNLGLREMIGILLQDEKVPGVHLAFGDPYGSQTSADWKSRTHVDVLTRDCDVWIDDEQVIADGQYLLEKFDWRGPTSRDPCKDASPSGR